MLNKLADRLALTAVERRVFLFLTLAFVAGLGVRLFRTTFASPPTFDYSAPDSAFISLSAAADSTAAAMSDTGAVNLNTADRDRLVRLPGIGPAMAARIVKEREERGPFRSLEDLRRVRGLGPKRIAQLRPLVTLD